MTTKQRLDLIRLLLKHESPVVTTLDWWDDGRARYEPVCYQFEYNQLRFWIDVVFGELLQYLDLSTRTVWYRSMSKNIPLKPGYLDHIDDCLLGYVREFNHEKVNEFVVGLDD